MTAPQFFYENQFRIDRPAGDSKFIKKIEKLIGKTFNFNKQCRPKRKNMIDDEYRKQGFSVWANGRRCLFGGIPQTNTVWP